MTQQVYVMEHVQILVSEAAAVSGIERAVDHLGCGDTELLQALSGHVLGPRDITESSAREVVSNILEDRLVVLRIVTDKHHQGVGGAPVARLEGDGHRPLVAGRRWAPVGEKQAEPLLFEPLALEVLRLGLRGPLVWGKGERLRSVLRLGPARAARLLLQGGEYQHHLRAVGGILGARERVGHGVLTYFVKHCVQRELVGAHQLRDVLHDRHHLLCVFGHRVHPARNVEADQRPVPS
mmetsp:Transcript_117809/g.319762  ORF Transcript_117809/g.319762 Transcript_117809/m.319762 type:complete len:237 (-) Transcript_117809:586-1296(-)